MHRRLTIVTRKALGDRISTFDARCQRMKASCTVSSASATLPSMRYAIEKRRPRCSSNTVTLSDASSLRLDDVSAISSGSRFMTCLRWPPHRMRGCPRPLDDLAAILGSIELVEVDIRRRQGSQEQQWVDDEQQRVADRKVRDAGRDQGDGETRVRE